MPLDKHYADFGGLDVSTNLLKAPPNSCRDGSTNFRWNYEDQLQKREGFQHKTDSGSNFCDGGLMEYIYTDIDTGNTLTQILSLGLDGFLYRIKKDYFIVSYDNTGTVASYALFYDESALTHKIVFYNSSDVVLGSTNISLTTTLDQLKTAVDALAITGLTASVQTEDGGSSSSKKAYLLETTSKYYFATPGSSSDANYVMYEQKIPFPDRDATGSNDYGTLGFKNSQANHQNGTTYEGISWINENNALYLTDGGFVYKYDQSGFCYRAGLPDLNRFKGWDIANSAIAGSLDSTKDYMYSFQLCHVDATGSFIGSNTLLTQAVTGDNAYSWIISGLQDTTFSTGWNPNKHFPIFSCCSGNSDQNITTSNFTFTVKTGHNIKIGMHLRFHMKPSDGMGSPTGQIGYRYLKVTAVTDTSITVSGSIGHSAKQGDINDSSFLGGNVYIWANTVINGCYLPTAFENTFIYIPNLTNDGMKWHPTPIYGAFLRIGRTIGDGGTLYQLYDAPIPHDKTWEYTYNDTLADAVTTFASAGLPTYSEYNGVSRIEADVAEIGKELPRACRYLASWQNQISQAGVDRYLFDLSIKGYAYPNFNKYGTSNISGGINFGKYQINDVCEQNSVYWADSQNIEGFPQSGANEEDFKYIYNDVVTGIYPNKEALFVFKEKTTGYLTGSPATGDIVKELLESDVGCATQGSIQDVRGSLVFMDQNLGFWSVVAGRLPEFIGNPLIDYFKNNEKIPQTQKLRFKLARSANFREQDQYICWIQAGDRNPSTGASSYSLMFVFDYSQIGKSKRNCWYKWNGLNAGGGVLATSDGRLLISSYGASQNRIWKQKFTGSKYDYSDHTSAIELSYKGAYLTYGEPTIDKSWIRCVISSVVGGFNLIVKQYANFINTSVSDYTISFPSSNRMAVKMDVKASIPKLSGLSWEFYNNDVNADVKIDGWEVEFNAPFDRSEPKK